MMDAIMNNVNSGAWCGDTDPGVRVGPGSTLTLGVTNLIS